MEIVDVSGRRKDSEARTTCVTEKVRHCVVP